MNTINEEYIIGSDECGTGSSVGQIVVCAVRALETWTLKGLRDSKKLSEKKRILLNEQLLELANENIIQISIAEKSNNYIDEFGLAKAHKDCYIESINKILSPNDEIIVDGVIKLQDYFQNNNVTAIIKADDIIPTVMAASIIAKTYRDEEIRLLHNEYPQYNWNSNIGYLTKEHKEAIKKYGLTKHHRKSYKLK